MIKHLTPRSEEEIENNIAKMTPEEKNSLGISIYNEDLIINSIEEDKNLASWFLLRYAIGYNFKKLKECLLDMDKLSGNNLFDNVKWALYFAWYYEDYTTAHLLEHKYNLSEEKYEEYKKWASISY